MKIFELEEFTAFYLIQVIRSREKGDGVINLHHCLILILITSVMVNRRGKEYSKNEKVIHI